MQTNMSSTSEVSVYSTVRNWKWEKEKKNEEKNVYI